MLGRSVAFVVITVVLVGVGPSSAFAQRSDQVGGGDELDCGHFFEGAQPDAQAVYEADPETLTDLTDRKGQQRLASRRWPVTMLI
jgi:hypothetical protein